MDARIGVEQDLHQNGIRATSEQLGTTLLRGLFPVRQEVFRKVVEALNQAVPSPLCREKQNSIAGPLQEYVVALEPEFER
jgi:hypothetical protein